MSLTSFAEKDEKSRVFYEAYQRDIQEEDTDDFSHLANDDMNEDENDADEEPESVTATEVREQLREIARQNKSGHGVRFLIMFSCPAS